MKKAWPKVLIVPDQHQTGPACSRRPIGHGSVYPIEGCFLATIAAELGGPVLEIGANHGISTKFIHVGLQRGGHDDPIYSVDVCHRWPPDEAQDEWPLRRATCADSKDYTPPEKCRWAFIDGDHTFCGVQADIDTAVVAGCRRLVFHDTAVRAQGHQVGGEDVGVRAAVLAWHKRSYKEWELTEIETPAGFIVAERRDRGREGTG